MMANKLEEMKRKLLLQTKKEKVEAVGSPVRVGNITPQVQASPSPEHASNPIRLAIQPSISQSADESAENQLEEEQHQPIDQAAQQAVIEPIILKQNSQPILAERNEIVAQQSQKEKLQAGEVQQAEEEQIVSQVLVPEASEKGLEDQQQSLELIREPNISVSIDEEARIHQAMQGKLSEMQKEMAAQKPAQSKAEKKTKKIVLKELIKVKECIKNLQSAVKGLEYVQQKLKLYPSLKERLHSYVMELKNFSNE